MPTYQTNAPSSEPHQGESIDPSGQRPHGYYRDAYFGCLAPIERSVTWNGHTNAVTLRILEADEQRWCSHFAYVRSEGHPESEEYLQARTIALIAKALVSVDGLPIASECKTLEQRLQLAAELPDTLQEALTDAYADVRYEPIALAQEMAQDPPSAPTPTPAGSSPEPEVSPSAV